METKRLVVIGIPARDPEIALDVEGEYVNSLADIVDVADADRALNQLIGLGRNHTLIYVAAPLDNDEANLLVEARKFVPNLVLDEALEILKGQIGESVESAYDFETAVFDAQARYGAPNTVTFVGAEEGLSTFHEPNRPSSTHTVKWCEDGTIEIDGCILRSTAIVGQGHVLTEVLHGVLTPEQVVGFVAQRLAVNGVTELLGYGRAFGPGKEDITNATLVPRSRLFRSRGLIGVVAASVDSVFKARPQMVVETANVLRIMFPRVPLFLHQQCKEIYWGTDALRAFRARVVRDDAIVWEPETGDDDFELESGDRIVLGGKSTKHTRVDAGSYVLYTEDEGYITFDAVLGQFEESNDGSIYAPQAVLDMVDGWLKETVKAVKDFNKMSQDLIARYYASHPLVNEGDEIAPGDPVFEVDGVQHRWNSKAAWGRVTKVVNECTSSLIRLEVHIDAHFPGELKLRGFGKGLVCPAEAAGISANVEGDETPRVIIGVPGIVKDSYAANEYILDSEPCVAEVTTEYCASAFEAARQKHLPDETLPEFEDDEDPAVLIKRYPNGVSLTFDSRNLTVTTRDPNAVKCRVRGTIEAAPVAQSVGTSSMTMPQLAWLSSFDAGNRWLSEKVLPGTKKKVNTLAYLHAVASGIVVED